jgi:hypothetical protein
MIKASIPSLSCKRAPGPKYNRHWSYESKYRGINGLLDNLPHYNRWHSEGIQHANPEDFFTVETFDII